MSESRELATHTGQGALAAAPVNSAQSVLAMVLEAARDPNIDAAKVETMANLAMKMQDREIEAQFNRDLNAAILEMPRISKQRQIIIPANKDRGTPERVQGRYAKFEDIDRVVRPILAKHNLTIRFEIGGEGALTTVRPIISHANGHVERGDAMRLPLEDSGSKNKTQGVGSSSSYGKRYAMCAALNIVTEGEDTDGRYFLEDDELNDRQQRLVAEAEAAAGNGEYQEWYGKQIAKERAWLVTAGVHGRLGGKALPKGRDEREEEAAPKTEDPPADPPAKKKPQTAEEWMAEYKIEARGAEDADHLRTIQERNKKGLDRLKTEFPALYRQIEDFHDVKLDELSRNGG